MRYIYIKYDIDVDKRSTLIPKYMICLISYMVENNLNCTGPLVMWVLLEGNNSLVIRLVHLHHTSIVNQYCCRNKQNQLSLNTAEKICGI